MSDEVNNYITLAQSHSDIELQQRNGDIEEEIDVLSEPRKIPIDEDAWVGIKKVKRKGDRLIYTYDENGQQICGAVTREGKPCRKKPVTDRNRCHFHGGKTPRGIVHHNATHLKYSRDMVGIALSQRYEDARKDKELLGMRDEIAILTARLGDVLKHVETGDTYAAWRQLRKEYDAMLKATREGKKDKVTDALNNIGTIITKGLGKHQNWNEISRLMETQKKLIESERKHLNQNKQVMTAEQAMSMLGFIVSVFKDWTYKYADMETANKILASTSKDIAKYLNDTNTNAAPPPPEEY